MDCVNVTVASPAPAPTVVLMPTLTAGQMSLSGVRIPDVPKTTVWDSPTQARRTLTMTGRETPVMQM